MFDDVDQNNSDQNSPSNPENDQGEATDQQGQKMTDSPFKVGKKEEKEEQAKEEQAKQGSKDSNSGETASNQAVSQKPGLDQKEPEDMFASTEGGQNSGSTAKPGQTNAANSPSGEGGGPTGKNKGGALKYIILGILAVIIIGGVAFWGANVLLSPVKENATSTPATPQDQDKDTSPTNEEQEPTEDISPDQDKQEDGKNKDENEEVSATTSPEQEEKTQDSDEDGLSDKQEEQAGTDPNKKDTDGDGLSDEEEFMEYDSNPLKKDTDGDGLSDLEEVEIYNTDPRGKDTDGDGYSDGEEVENGYNPAGEGELKK